MKTVTKLLAAPMVIMLLCGTIASCGGGDSAIVGVWDGTGSAEGTTYEFKSNGDAKMSAAGIGYSIATDATYKTSGKTLTITYREGGITIEEKYTYDISGDTLQMTLEGDTLVLKKR